MKIVEEIRVRYKTVVEENMSKAIDYAINRGGNNHHTNKALIQHT